MTSGPFFPFQCHRAIDLSSVSTCIFLHFQIRSKRLFIVCLTGKHSGSALLRHTCFFFCLCDCGGLFSALSCSRPSCSVAAYASSCRPLRCFLGPYLSESGPYCNLSFCGRHPVSPTYPSQSVLPCDLVVEPYQPCKPYQSPFRALTHCAGCPPNRTPGFPACSFLSPSSVPPPHRRHAYVVL